MQEVIPEWLGRPLPLTARFAVRRRMAPLFVCLLVCLGVSGCGRFHPKPADKYVYVIAKQTYLRDRVAAVSNRTGNVSNGERLIVLERARRFVKVRSPRGEVGWIEEKLTADQALADKFEDLRQKHLQDSTVAQATARDEVYLHIAPGRETDRFFRLAEGDKLNLLVRATVPKPVPSGSTPAPVKPVAKHKPAPADKTAKPASDAGGKADADEDTDKAKPERADEQPAAPPPAMEDWWLVRDKDGQTGWIYARMIDVDAPDVLARYSEGQRIVGAYILAHVEDPDSGVLNNGQTVTSIPEYLTVLSPYQSGLPYDFNQVRVFIWNAKKHRYETSFREHNIAGYLPVQLSEKTDPYTKTPLGNTALPTFSYRVLAAEAPVPTPDPATGTVTPGKTITKTYRLEGQLCRRILPPGTQVPEEARPNPESDKKKKEGKKHRR